MSVSKFRRAVLVACVSGIAVSGCGGDRLLGAPEVSGCTAGTLKLGTKRSGVVDETSCLMWHEDDSYLYRAESWTLETKANTAYIARLVPAANPLGDVTFSGDLSLYTRNAAGEPTYVTGYWSGFGPQGINGSRGVEMIFPAYEDGTVSLRVSSYSPATHGAYDIVVTACPIARVSVGAAAVPQAFADGECDLLSDGARFPYPTPVRFFGFEAEAGVSYTTTIARPSGTSNLFARVRGPAFDFGCYQSSSCVRIDSPTGAGPYSLVFTPAKSGPYTVLVYQHGAGSLTASVRVVETPVAVISSTTANR